MYVDLVWEIACTFGISQDSCRQVKTMDSLPPASEAQGGYQPYTPVAGQHGSAGYGPFQAPAQPGAPVGPSHPQVCQDSGSGFYFDSNSGQWSAAVAAPAPAPPV